jgi:adenosylcobinamide amidohydrolase
MRTTLQQPWMICDLGQDKRVLSWTLNQPGFCHSRHILWREVRNSDLPPDRDVKSWLGAELFGFGFATAPCLLTSRRMTAFETAAVTVAGISATCVATVGLSNAERVGTRMDRRGKDWGTINIAVSLNCGLADGAFLECLSIATQARTAAVLEAGYPLTTGTATGTGTDCIAIAADPGGAEYAGLHTAIGEATGAAVYGAICRGLQVWLKEHAGGLTTSQERKR